MHVDVVGEKYTMRRPDCVAPSPWSPKSWVMLCRSVERRMADVMCEGVGACSVMNDGVDLVGTVVVVVDGEEEVAEEVVEGLCEVG